MFSLQPSTPSVKFDETQTPQLVSLFRGLSNTIPKPKTDESLYRDFPLEPSLSIKDTMTSGATLSGKPCLFQELHSKFESLSISLLALPLVAPRRAVRQLNETRGSLQNIKTLEDGYPSEKS